MKIFNYKLDWSFGSFGADYHRDDGLGLPDEIYLTTNDGIFIVDESGSLITYSES